jgi:hypothetical protein
MTKSQLRKEAYRRIVKDGETHQWVYEDLKDATGFDRVTVAGILAKIPSKRKEERNRILKVLFIGLLVLIVIQRLSHTLPNRDNLPRMVIEIIIDITADVLIPVTGIISVLQYRVNVYRILGFLFIFDIVRSFLEMNPRFPHMNPDFEFTIMAFIPYVAVLILIFWFLKFPKMRYKETFVTEIHPDGSEHKARKILFKDDSLENGDLLDSEI